MKFIASGIFAWGYLGKTNMDLLRKSRELKTFTFLRHPVERTMSYVDIHRRRGETGSIKEILDGISRSKHLYV